MSRIDELIRDLCPNGVPYQRLATVGEWFGGGTPSKSRTEYWDGGTIPWVSPKDMGRAIVDSSEDYITESAVKGSATRLVPPTSVAMVVRSSILDRTFPTALVPVHVALNQDMKAVVPRDGVQAGYLAHLLRSRGPEILRVARKSGGSVASIESGKLFSFRIPIPPMEVQREIVRILDLFTSLEAELEAELEKRRQQYAHYRDSLLTFPEGGVRWIPMGELAEFKYGFTARARDEGAFRFLRITDVDPWGKLSPGAAKYVDDAPGLSDYLVKPGDLLMARTGATFGKTMLVHLAEPSVFASFLIRISFPDGGVLPAFYWHFAQSTRYWSQANAMVSTGGQPQFNANALKQVVVPVPPLADQVRIASILDQFDALVNDLSIGLPAELKARRKQYEHYRDRLLTFKEAA